MNLTRWSVETTVGPRLDVDDEGHLVCALAKASQNMVALCGTSQGYAKAFYLLCSVESVISLTSSGVLSHSSCTLIVGVRLTGQSTHLLFYGDRIGKYYLHQLSSECWR